MSWLAQVAKVKACSSESLLALDAGLYGLEALPESKSAFSPGKSAPTDAYHLDGSSQCQSPEPQGVKDDADRA